MNMQHYLFMIYLLVFGAVSGVVWFLMQRKKKKEVKYNAERVELMNRAKNAIDRENELRMLLASHENRILMHNKIQDEPLTVAKNNRAMARRHPQVSQPEPRASRPSEPVRRNDDFDLAGAIVGGMIESAMSSSDSSSSSNDSGSSDNSGGGGSFSGGGASGEW